MIKRVLLTALVATTLTGCSTVKGVFSSGGEGLEVTDQEPFRTETKDLIKGLPNDLRGDKKNARYTNTPLRGDDNAND